MKYSDRFLPMRVPNERYVKAIDDMIAFIDKYEIDESSLGLSTIFLINDERCCLIGINAINTTLTFMPLKPEKTIVIDFSNDNYLTLKIVKQ